MSRDYRHVLKYGKISEVEPLKIQEIVCPHLSVLPMSKFAYRLTSGLRLRAFGAPTQPTSWVRKPEARYRKCQPTPKRHKPCLPDSDRNSYLKAGTL